MSEDFRFGSYEFNAQRHIYPLYAPDGLGGYSYSSTMTFINKDGYCFCVFAAHAIGQKSDGIDQIGYFNVEGSFISISEVAIEFKICRERDLIACLTATNFEDKNYFYLDGVQSLTEFTDNFAWIGFPKKKAIEKFHYTKASEADVKSLLVETVGGQIKWKNAEYLFLEMSVDEETEISVAGLHINENVTYEHEGFKVKGYSLRGMSGGPFFKMPRKFIGEPTHSRDMYQFYGIGLEYLDGRVIKGASRNSVEELLDEVIKKFNKK